MTMTPTGTSARTAAAWLAPLLVLLMLGGCASRQYGQRTESGTVSRQPPASTGDFSRPVPAQVPVPITSTPGETAIAPPPVVIPNYPKSAEQISGQAVLSLMKQAQTARAAGQFDQASGALERAQRIEPRNYFVWSALSRVYLDKKLYDNAESVAQKSNSLARGNVYVELENWKVISAARSAQGNAIGAIQAQNKIDEIRRNLNISGG